MSRADRPSLRALATLLLIPLAAGCAGGPRGPGARGFDPDSVPEAYARSTAALMWPGSTRAWQITPGGDLYNGEWCVRLVTPAAAPRAIAFEDRWLPVARWTRAGDGVRWEFEAVALPGPAARDSGLVASLTVQAVNTGTVERSARLEVRLDPPQAAVFAAFDAPERPVAALRMGTGRSGAAVQGWCADLQEGGSALRWTLAPGSRRSARLVLPAYATSERALAGWAARPHESRVEEVRRYWTSEVDRGARFELGDPEVEAALRAAEVTLLALRARHGSAWVPLANPFQYRDVWLRDGARAIRALAVMGYARETRGLCAGLADLQWPDGAFLSQRGQLDGTGQALWAFEQALLRPAPDDSLGRYAASVERAWRWIEWQRGLGRRSGWPFGTMLPYGDPRDGELVRAQLTGNDAWALAGYHAAARLLAAAGRQPLSGEVERSRAGYLADFRSALERTGSRDLPPSWQETGRDWGNLAIVSPCGAFAAASPRAAALARRVWATAGGAGLATYGPPDTLHSYYGADLGTWALLAGRQAEADSVLGAMLRWRSASGGAAELFSRTSRDFGANLPPHGTAAAALASLLRDGLIFDDGDTLRLTLGARTRWWSGARVRRAPTYWGPIELEFRRRGDTAEWHWSAVPVWTALTLPPGTRPAGEPPAPLRRGGSDRVVLAPPGTREATVRLIGGRP